MDVAVVVTLLHKLEEDGLGDWLKLSLPAVPVIFSPSDNLTSQRREVILNAVAVKSTSDGVEAEAHI